MTMQSQSISQATEERWLKQYYFARAAFSVAWVTLMLTVGVRDATAAAALLIVYPAWDGLANYLDAAQSGGLGENRTQAINVAVSVATTAAVILALQNSMNDVLGVFGAWAIFAGLLQLGTAIRRWKSYGAQWAMILSGAQSALAGGFFIHEATASATPSASRIAGYAGVGALYFLISAVLLAVRESRRKSA